MGEQATGRLRRDACPPSEGTAEARPLPVSPRGAPRPHAGPGCIRAEAERLRASLRWKRPSSGRRIQARPDARLTSSPKGAGGKGEEATARVSGAGTAAPARA